MSNPVKLVGDLFDLSKASELDKAIKLLERSSKVYDQLLKNVSSKKGEFKKGMDEIVKASNGLSKSIERLDSNTEKGRNEIVQTNKQAKDLAKTYDALKGKVSGLSDTEQRLLKERKAVNEKTKEAIRLEKEKTKLTARLSTATSKEAAENEKLRQRLNLVNKERREAAKEALGQITLYQKESARVNKLAKDYLNLSIKYGQNSKQARAVKLEHDKLRASLFKLESAVGRRQRDVANYSNSLRGMKNALVSVAGAFGFIGVIYLFANAVRNAFKAVRDFDKEMVNLASILGKNRSDLKGLELEIRRVAKTSINTANDVAKLATSLITLGQSEQEVKDLLEPINNLSIALQAPADAAGELLVQTLNAFGESSDAAQEYADIIAKMRTSTALDFERIKDSLAFLSPVAKAVGIDFAETGAILGTLVDNGIRAARAGRLMSSSFSRLNKLGISLNEAIAQVNESTDKTKTATRLFGTESFALGLILAENTKKTNEYAQAFRNSGGALEELTKGQLKSLSAQIQILDSNWTEFILSIENGSGTFGVAISSMIEGVSNLIRLVTPDIKGFDKGIGIGDKIKVENKEFEKEIKKYEKTYKLLLNTIKSNEKKIEEGSKIENGARKITLLDEKKIEEDTDFLRDQASITRGILASLIKRKQDAGDVDSELGTETSALLEGEKELRNGVISLLEEEIKLKKELKSQASSESEIEALNAQIRGRENELNRLKNLGLGVFDDLEKKGVESIKPITAEIEELPKAMEKVETQANSTFSKFGVLLRNIGLELKKMPQELVISFNDAFIALEDFISAQQQKRIEQNDLRIAELESQRDRELEIAGENEAAKLKIRKDYDNKIARLEAKNRAERTKAARREKAVAIAQATINVAAAVVQNIANPILAFAIGALGATQIALMAGTPIPAFEKGTDYAPAGDKIVGEKGRELVITPNGVSFLTGNKAEVRRDIPEGSQILTNAITENILRGGNDRVEVNDNASKSLRDVSRAEQYGIMKNAVLQSVKISNEEIKSSFDNAIKSLPEIHQWYLSKGDLTKSVTKGLTTHQNVEQENTYG